MPNIANLILGEDFITPEEIMVACPSVVYSDEQVAELMATLPDGETLAWMRDNDYALMPAPPRPLTLIDVRKIQREFFFAKENSPCDSKDFAIMETTLTGWLAIRKKVIPGSREGWQRGNDLLAKNERVPSAVEAAWFITMYAGVRGIRLFPLAWRGILTTSVYSDGRRVCVGGFGEDGLHFYTVLLAYKSNEYSGGEFGISSALKSFQYLAF